MKNNGFRLLLKIWVAIASVIAFLGGWVVLGHSGKPASAQMLDGQNKAPVQGKLAPLPTLAPLSPLDSASRNSGSGSGLQLLPQQSQPSLQLAQPRLRTRGS